MTCDPERPSRGCTAVRLSVVGLGLVTGAALFLWIAWRLVWVEPAEAEADRLRAELNGQLDAFAWKSWQRPVLRGRGRRCNAAAAARTSLLDFAAVEAIDPNIESILELKRPSPTLVEFARRHADRLEQLRAASGCEQAWLAEPSLARSGRTVPDELSHLRSVELLLVLALDDTADRCLEKAADAVRLAQDLVPGGGFARLVFAAMEIGHATSVAADCAGRATNDARHRALGSFTTLVRHGPPFARALQAEALLNAVGHSAEFDLRPRLPRVAGSALSRARTHPQRLLEAWRFELGRAKAAESILGLSWSELLALTEKWEKLRLSSKNPLIATPPTGSRELFSVQRAAEAQARLIAVTSLLALMVSPEMSSEQERLQRALSLEQLRDPFTGSGLRWRRRSEHGAHIAYSVGLNQRDDDGGADDIAVTWMTESSP